MPIEILVKQATGLPDKYVDMVISYIHFLQAEAKQETDHKPRKLGVFSNRFEFISEDFNEPLDAFREYM